MVTTLSEDHVPGLLAAFDLGSWGQLSDGPFARGRLGAIWRLDSETGSWAVKQVGETSDDELAEILEGAAFQEAALAAGVPTPGVRRTPSGDLIAPIDEVCVRLHAWVDLEDPNFDLDPVQLGALVARLHGVDFAGTIGVDPWYTEPIGDDRWSEVIAALRKRRAPFADDLASLVPEIVALEKYLGSPAGNLRTCHRDLWADNLRSVRLRLR